MKNVTLEDLDEKIIFLDNDFGLFMIEICSYGLNDYLYREFNELFADLFIEINNEIQINN